MNSLRFAQALGLAAASTGITFAGMPPGTGTGTGTGTGGCPVQMVIIMDTSGSMSDEIGALCTDLAGIVSTLQAQNINVTAEFLGITNTRDCLTDDVLNLFGPTVPMAPTCCTTLNQLESWGPASAIVAERYPWVGNGIRLIIPVSDEGPWRGNSCNGDDMDSAMAAAAVAAANQAILAPIAGTGSNQCVIDLGSMMAAATGGQSFVSTDPAFDLAGFIISLTSGTCAGTGTIGIDCIGVSCPCGNDTTASDEGCLNSTGAGGKLSWTGGTSVAANDLSLEMSGIPSFEFSMVAIGTDPPVPCVPLGDGLLGIQPALPNAWVFFPIQKSGSQGQYSTGPGVAQELANLTGQTPLQLIGTTYRFQGVYRDQLVAPSPCGTGFNLTNVVEVQFSN